jgi:hypothetical protein
MVKGAIGRGLGTENPTQSQYQRFPVLRGLQL